MDWRGASDSCEEVFLDSNVYFDVNNVTISTTNGTTQIDHIIVSQYGIFVVETKNMEGWILGMPRIHHGLRACLARNQNSKTLYIRIISISGHYQSFWGLMETGSIR